MHSRMRLFFQILLQNGGVFTKSYIYSTFMGFVLWTYNRKFCFLPQMLKQNGGTVPNPDIFSRFLFFLSSSPWQEAFLIKMCSSLSLLCKFFTFSSQEPRGQFQLNFLTDSGLFKWWATPFPKGEIIAKK